MTCTKKSFPGKEAAITFHQTHSRKPYYVYQCPEHYPAWHITTTGIHESVTEEIVRIIQQGRNYSTCAYLGRVSKKKTILLVHHRIGSFVVVYHKGQDTVDVIMEVLPVDTIEDIMASVAKINQFPVACLNEARATLETRERKGR